MMCHVSGCRALSDIASVIVEQSVLLNTLLEVAAHQEEFCDIKIIKSSGGEANGLVIGLISIFCGALLQYYLCAA